MIRVRGRAREDRERGVVHGGGAKREGERQGAGRCVGLRGLDIEGWAIGEGGLERPSMGKEQRE